jgi:hypothetical protein
MASSFSATATDATSTEWVREEGGGNVYRWAEKDMEGWLCPALFKHFERTPQKLYIQVKAAG